MDEPDPQVIAAARRGDLHAFEALVRRYQADVWRLCLYLAHDETVAEEAAQEALVRTYRFLPKYRGRSKFTTWLFAIVRNCVNDELRKTARRNRLSARLSSQPESTITDETLALDIREALAALPAELREGVVLIDVLGISYHDAAQTLRVPEGTLKSRVHRARAMLARTLGYEREEGSREA